MAGISNYLKDQFLNGYWRDTAMTSPTNVFVALFSTLPNDAGTGGTELSAGNYARVSVATTNAAWDAPAAGSGTIRFIQNTAVIDFGTASAAWAPAAACVGYGFYDASTGGNYLGGNLFSTPKTIESGDPVKFNAGALDVQISGS